MRSLQDIEPVSHGGEGERKIVSRDTIQQISISNIDPNPDQPRKTFRNIDELAKSIEIHGIQTPLVVEPSIDGRYTLISGERRTRAASLIGFETVPAIVCDGGDRAVLALVENVQRDDLSPLEEARAYQTILNRGMTQDELSRMIGKDRTYISQKLRLLVFSGTSVETAMLSDVSEGAARQLLRLKVFDEISTKKDRVYKSWLEKYSNDILWRPNYARSVREVSDLVDEYLTVVYLYQSESIPSDAEIRIDINQLDEKRKRGEEKWWEVEIDVMSRFMRHAMEPDFSKLSEKQENELLNTMKRWFKNHVYNEALS